MRVEVKFHHRTQQEMTRWRRTLAHDPRERRRQFQTYLDAMTDHFRKHNGTPPEAVVRGTPAGPTYRWRYSSTLLIEFTVSERPRRPRGWWDVRRIVERLFRPVVRKVVITRAYHPPPQP